MKVIYERALSIYMKTSFITTVYNEESTIKHFLKSLLDQTVLPDEIIIVDANSSDNTKKVIENFFVKNNIIPHLLIIKPGNRSIGRNEAIENATHEIILCSDAGCILDSNWIKKLLEKFRKKNVDVVSGYYKPI